MESDPDGGLTTLLIVASRTVAEYIYGDRAESAFDRFAYAQKTMLIMHVTGMKGKSMNHQEAKIILDRYIEDFRHKSFQDLRQIMESGHLTFEVDSPSGTEYQIEIDVMWDSRRHNTLRLFGNINDGRLQPWRLIPFASDAISESVIIQLKYHVEPTLVARMLRSYFTCELD